MYFTSYTLRVSSGPEQQLTARTETQIFTSKRHNLRYQERASLRDMFAKKPFPVHGNVPWIY